MAERAGELRGAHRELARGTARRIDLLTVLKRRALEASFMPARPPPSSAQAGAGCRRRAGREPELQDLVRNERMNWQ